MKKFSAIFLILTALASLLFFVFLFLAVRPDPDDMLISIDLRENSLFYVLQKWYLRSSFRLTLLTLDQLILGYKNTEIYPVTIFIFYFSLFLFLVFTLYKLMKEIFSLSLQTSGERALLVSFSVVQATAIYFFCSERIEVFGWIAASEAHLTPVVFALFSTWLISKKIHHKSDFVLLAFSALVIAGGAEHINLWVIVSGTVIAFLSWKEKLRMSMDQKRRLIFFTVAVMVFFACIITNPGALSRVGEVNDYIAGKENYGSLSFFEMFFKPYKLLGLVLVVASLYVFQKIFMIERFPTVRIRLLLVFCIGTGLICAFMSLMAYQTLSFGRVWLPFDLSLYILFCAFVISLFQGEKIPAFAGPGFVGLSLAGLSFHDARHIPALHNFATKYEMIVRDVRKASPGQTVMVYDFPQPDLVNLVELSPNPENEMNRLFCRFHNSEGKISVETNK